jgi:hypothetical protein
MRRPLESVWRPDISAVVTQLEHLEMKVRDIDLTEETRKGLTRAVSFWRSMNMACRSGKFGFLHLDWRRTHMAEQFPRRSDILLSYESAVFPRF